MIKQRQKEVEAAEEIEVALTKTERFIEENQRSLLIILGAIIAVVGIYWAYQWYSNGENKKAQAQMFVAEQYFERDSFKLALNGDGNYPGFLEIIDKFGSTRAGNLSSYYAGISYLNLGNFDEAIKYLNDFDSDDKLVSTIAKGAMGDAYMEKGEVEKAISYFVKASENFDNSYSSPLFLMKAGFAYEKLGQFDKALEIYDKIKKDYSRSNEGRKVDKYIARAKVKSNKS